MIGRSGQPNGGSHTSRQGPPRSRPATRPDLAEPPGMRVTAASAGSSNCSPNSERSWASIREVVPPRHTPPWRRRNFDSRCRTRVRSVCCRPRRGTSLRTASSVGVGTQTATSSPWCSHDEPMAAPRIGLGPDPQCGRISDGTTSCSPRNCRMTARPERSSANACGSPHQHPPTASTVFPRSPWQCMARPTTASSGSRSRLPTPAGRAT
jgi:hypothetical protein